MKVPYFQSHQPRKIFPMLLLLSTTLLCLFCLISFYLLSPSPLLSILLSEEAEFQSYLSTYSKSYPSESEYYFRFQTFRENQVFIRYHNSQSSTFTLGLTSFSDLTAAEFNSRLSPKPLRASSVSEATPNNLEVPSQVDWRTKGAVTPVKNQGACGSCWAFSATGAIESVWIISGHSMVTVSEQQLIDCSNSYGNKGCSGGFYEFGYDYVIGNGGVTSEANYPYTALDGICIKKKESQVVARIRGKYEVQGDSPSALQSAVALQPCSVSVQANQEFWQHYTSGTITSGCGTKLDHDVLAVGYDTTVSVPFWIVKNSWGADWGMAGYIQIAITSGKGVCGINIQPGYPIA